MQESIYYTDNLLEHDIVVKIVVKNGQAFALFDGEECAIAITGDNVQDGEYVAGESRFKNVEGNDMIDAKYLLPYQKTIPAKIVGQKVDEHGVIWFEKVNEVIGLKTMKPEKESLKRYLDANH